MHQALFPLWSNPTHRGRKTVIAAPRGHAKTTIMLFSQVIHAICYGYEPYIVIVAQTTPEGESRVGQIRDQLLHNESILSVFGQLLPDKGASKKGFTTLNNVRVEAISRGQNMRGRIFKGNRPSLFILDDVETLEGAQNPEQRQKTLDWLQKDVISTGQTGGSSNITVIGTCLHDESLISYLRNQPDWLQQKYQAVESWAVNQALWDRWTHIITDLSNSSRMQDADAFFLEHEAAMLEGTKVLWPEVESYEYLMKYMLSLGRKAFFSEKQNEPFDPTTQIFNMEAAHYFTFNSKTQTITCLQRDYQVQLQDLVQIVAFHDPCVGESDQGDYAAIIVAAKDLNGFYFVLDVFIERCQRNQQIEAAFRLYQKWKYHILVVETTNFQILIKQDQEQRFKGVGNPPVIQGMNQSVNKELRISALEPLVYSGRLIFNQTLDPKLFHQLKYFPSASHDDGPDALEGAIQRLAYKRGPSNTIHPSAPLVRKPAQRRPSQRR